MKISKFLLCGIAVLTMALSGPSHAGLFGVPKFKVTQSDDRFSTDGTTTYTGQWNRISKKSLAGGVHIDDMGLFVEPIVVRNRTDGRVVVLGFLIHNEHSTDSALGDPLAFGELRRITFVTGEGAPIALEIDRPEQARIGGIAYNSITRTASAHMSESEFAIVSAADFHRLVAAQSLLAKVEGSKRSMVYEARDIAKAFQPNLAVFWSGYVVRPEPKTKE